MAKTLRNIIATAAILGALLSPQKANAQTQVVSAGGGIDTVYAVTANGLDSAKIVNWSKDGTTGVGAVEVNGVLYIAESPSAHHDSSTTFNTRKIPGKNYGYTIRVDEILDGGITVANLGRTNNPAPEPIGKEYLFKTISEEQTINGQKFKLLGLGTNSNIYLKQNNNTTITLKPNEETTIDGEKYMNTLAFADGKPNGFSFARVATEEPSTVIRRNIPSTQYRTNSTNGNTMKYDILGKQIGRLTQNDIARNVMSKHPSGMYIVKMPNGYTSLERTIK